MNTDKTSVQLIDDISAYTGEVSFRLRYTSKGKVLKNIKLPFTAPAKVNKKDVKAVMYTIILEQIPVYLSIHILSLW
jgi:hypothetical protein